MFDFELLTPYIEIIFPMSLIIAIMLLMVPVMNKRYVAKARYFIWLVIAIRLLLPFDINVSKEPVHLFTAPISDFTIIREDVVDYIRQENVDGTVSQMEFFKNKDVTDKTDDSQASSVEKVEKPMFANFPIISLHTIIEWVWSLGTVGLFMYYILQYFIAKVHIRKFSRKDSYAQITLNSLCKKMNIKRKLKIYRCNCVNSAMIMGVLFPAIFIPDTETSDEMLEMILYHELTHYKRKDILYKFVLMLACCVHWFNPLVWLMDRQAQKDVEICCDDDVIKGHSEEFKRKYSESILKMVKFGVMRKTAFSTGFAMDKKTLASRFRNIFDSRIKHSGKAVLATVLALCIMSTTLISCAPKQEEKFDIPQQAMDLMEFMLLTYNDTDIMECSVENRAIAFDYLLHTGVSLENYLYVHEGHSEPSAYHMPYSEAKEIYQFLLADKLDIAWDNFYVSLDAGNYLNYKLNYNYNKIEHYYANTDFEYSYQCIDTEKINESNFSATFTRVVAGLPYNNLNFYMEKQVIDYVPKALQEMYSVGEEIWRIKDIEVLENKVSVQQTIEIDSKEDFLDFIDNVNRYGYSMGQTTFVLTSDIDLNGMTIEPIGFNGDNIIDSISHNMSSYFSGIFDGNGHTISNFSVRTKVNTNEKYEYYVALFNVLNETAVVKNLNIVNADISHNNEHESIYSAILAGVSKGTIENCSVSGTVTAQGGAGGLVGRNSGIIRNCNVNAEVTAGSVAGVFAGELENGSIIKNCNVYGQIHGVRKYNINNPEIIGGFSGYLLNSQVDNCSIDVIIDIEDGGYGNYGIVSGVALNSTITNFEYNKNVTLNYNFSGDSNNSTLFDVKEH